ncbi:MAG: TonB-dependent receptor [Nitrosomonadales bacterium]
MLNNAEEYRMFANDEWRYTPSLIINAGGMLESDAMGYKTFSPRASLNYHLNRTNTIRLGASVAHRTPALAEQLGSVLIDIPGVNSPTPVEPEKLLSREIGYLGEFHDWGTSFDLRIFDDQLSNGIFPILILGSSSNWSNGMSGTYEGFEATVKHSFGEFSNLTFNFAHELAYSNIASLPGVSLPIPGQDALAMSIPKNSISLQYALRLYNNFSFSTDYYLQSSMKPFDRNLIDFQPTQHRTDIRISQSFKGVAGLSGEVSGVVQNLFKTDYTEYVATDLFNRRAFVTLTLHWQ